MSNGTTCVSVVYEFESRHGAMGFEAMGFEREVGDRKRPAYIAGTAGLIILLIILIVSLCPAECPSPVPSPTPTPSVTPTQPPPVVVWIDAPDKVARGAEFVATVNISQVSNLDIAQYDIAYNSDVLKVLDVTDGSIDGMRMPVDMWGYILPCCIGRIRVLNNAPGTYGISGQGYLAEVHFLVTGLSGET